MGYTFDCVWDFVLYCGQYDGNNSYYGKFWGCIERLFCYRLMTVINY